MIEINTLNEFIAFANGEYGRGNSGAYLDVILTADIDFLDGNISNWAGCKGNWYVNFNGQGHSIKNIDYINTTTWSLFETIYGTLQNLVLEDICAISTNGNIAGFAYNCYANISNCRITGYLASYSHAIGLVYLARNAVTISNCLFEGTLVSFNAETMAFSLDGGSCRFVKCGFMGIMKASSTLSPFANMTTCEDCFYSGTINGVTLRPFSYQCNCIRCYLAINRNSVISNAVQDSSTVTNCCFDAEEASAGNFLNMITSIFPSATQAQTQQLKDINWLTGTMSWSADVWTTGEENDGYAYIKGVIPSGFEYFDTDEQGIAENKLVWRIKNTDNEGYPWSGELQQAFEYFEQDSAGYPKNNSAWKFDTQNDGYPWITGYLELTPKSTLPSLPYMLSSGTLSYMSGSIIDNNTLQPIFIYKKGENI